MDMEEQIYALRGDICYSRDKNHLQVVDKGYVVCDQGRSAGVFSELPDGYRNIPIRDYSEALIIPGLTDLHVHAPQFAFRGLGMDLELLEWLIKNAFPEEARYEDPEYARKSYAIFTEALKKSATTRAAVFATLHVEATQILMELIEASGINALVGKVNMDRNSPDYLCEKSPIQSAADTRRWIKNTAGKYKNVKPILTPRFIPACTDELMKELSAIQKEYNLPLQSHLSENLKEIAFVKELCPDIKFYGMAYEAVGLFGGECPTIMAHCVYSTEDEINLMKEQGVFVAHCPQSNINLASGIAPIRTYLNRDINVGLGSDIAGGFSESIFRAMSDAIQVSKLYWRFIDHNVKPLTVEEAFYLGTKGGGAFFGKVGSFEAGYEFDAVVLDDRNLPHPQELNTKQRLERLIYISDGSNIISKYVAGNQIF
jgi:guanine deaminase